MQQNSKTHGKTEVLERDESKTKTAQSGTKSCEFSKKFASLPLRITYPVDDSCVTLAPDQPDVRDAGCFPFVKLI